MTSHLIIVNSSQLIIRELVVLIITLILEVGHYGSIVHDKTEDKDIIVRTHYGN